MAEARAVLTGNARMTRDPDAQLCGWGRCTQRIPAGSDAPLCREHHFRAWHAWQQDEVQALHVAADARNATAQAERAPDERVYFLRFGDRVKIGYTADIDQRIRAVPHDDVLHVLPGDRLDERRVHAAFAHLRITGEWFHAAPDLLAFIDDLRRDTPTAERVI